MRYKVIIKYKETCPKCKHKLARAAGYTRGGKRQLSCESCGHRFPKGSKLLPTKVGSISRRRA